MVRAWRRAGKVALVMTALLALALAGTEGWAKGGSGGHGGGHSGSHHGHHHGSHQSHSSGSGAFFYGSYFAFPAYWYADAYPYLPSQPVYYIERSEEELRSSSLWYYCESEAAYYPYVAQCPAGWIQVEPFTLP
jgi:hypothetical protein